jgi:hypothetical protein
LTIPPALGLARPARALNCSEARDHQDIEAVALGITSQPMCCGGLMPAAGKEFR